MYCSASSLVSGLEGVSPREVIEGIRNEDPAMFGILERYTDALSSALVSIVNLLDPEVIALGGGVSNAGEPLLEATSRKLREKSFFTAEYRIVQASMGNEAGMVGAAIAHQCL
jgi:glucokinase